MVELLCNCYHDMKDHKQLELGFYTWCRYSEVGQCPCDRFTQIDNLSYLEYKDQLNTIEKLLKEKNL